MRLTFIELSSFEKYRSEYLTDEEYRNLQNELLDNPTKGDVIQGTNGLRKIRITDSKRNKGKRGGARVIYYYVTRESLIYFFTIYGKDIKDDLSQVEKSTLAGLVKIIKGE
ncbi:toxin [Ursidibacter sp. B-7004-1]